MSGRHISRSRRRCQHYFPRSLLLFLSIYCTLLLLPACTAHIHKLYRRHRHIWPEQQHFAKNEKENPPEVTKFSGKQRRASKLLMHCPHGTAVSGRCICDRGYAGTWCERKMHCANFERALDGSCAICKPNYAGERCERIVCQNGGEEAEFEQSCKCPAPFTGNFCEDLQTRNVYYFYNSKFAAYGPLGVIAILPMLGTYLVCERYARKRQVKRIEKSWSGLAVNALNRSHIEKLLKERTNVKH